MMPRLLWIKAIAVVVVDSAIVVNDAARGDGYRYARINGKCNAGINRPGLASTNDCICSNCGIYGKCH